MAVLKKGEFKIDLGFVKLGADFEESDRQCAWELYTELSTRVAVTGKVRDDDATDFSGEVLSESLDSLYAFFQEARIIMRQFPVGAINARGIENHLGALVHRAIRDVLRPFLEKWQGKYRHWWEWVADKSLPPMERQNEFPELKLLLSDWSDLRSIMRAIQRNLVTSYKLVDVSAS